MSTEPQEYTDEATGVRLTVLYDIPEHPLLTAYPPEGSTLAMEECHGAIHRLLAKAGIRQAGEQGGQQ